MHEERSDLGELIESLRELAKELAELERELVILAGPDAGQPGRLDLSE